VGKMYISVHVVRTLRVYLIGLLSGYVISDTKY
jgi:hypothetical protein